MQLQPIFKGAMFRVLIRNEITNKVMSFPIYNTSVDQETIYQLLKKYISEYKEE